VNTLCKPNPQGLPISSRSVHSACFVGCSSRGQNSFITPKMSFSVCPPGHDEETWSVWNWSCCSPRQSWTNKCHCWGIGVSLHCYISCYISQLIASWPLRKIAGIIKLLCLRRCSDIAYTRKNVIVANFSIKYYFSFYSALEYSKIDEVQKRRQVFSFVHF